MNENGSSAYWRPLPKTGVTNGSGRRGGHTRNRVSSGLNIRRRGELAGVSGFRRGGLLRLLSLPLPLLSRVQPLDAGDQFVDGDFLVVGGVDDALGRVLGTIRALSDRLQRRGELLHGGGLVVGGSGDLGDAGGGLVDRVRAISSSESSTVSISVPASSIRSCERSTAVLVSSDCACSSARLSP